MCTTNPFRTEMCLNKARDGTPFATQAEAHAYDIYMDREATRAKFYYFFPEEANIINLCRNAKITNENATQTSDVSISKQPSTTSSTKKFDARARRAARRNAPKRSVIPSTENAIIRQPRPPPLLTTPPAEEAGLPESPIPTEQVEDATKHTKHTIAEYCEARNIENEVNFEFASKMDDFAEDYLDNELNAAHYKDDRLNYHQIIEFLAEQKKPITYALNVIQMIEDHIRTYTLPAIKRTHQENDAIIQQFEDVNAEIHQHN